MSMAKFFKEKNIKRQSDNYFTPQIIKTLPEGYSIEKFQNSRDRYNFYNKIINNISIIIFVILIIISADTILVQRYNKKPIFAIKTAIYDDGGTEIYFGLGYKVIAYNQTIGRRDKEIGSWSLKYNDTPLNIEDFDLAIEFENNYKLTSKKYHKKYVKIKTTQREINNEYAFQYYDDGGKYTLNLKCNRVNKKDNIENGVYLIGTIDVFKIGTEESPNEVYLNNCFIESSN